MGIPPRALIWELANCAELGEGGVGRAAAAEERRGLEKAEGEWRGRTALGRAQAGPKPGARAERQKARDGWGGGAGGEEEGEAGRPQGSSPSEDVCPYPPKKATDESGKLAPSPSEEEKAGAAAPGCRRLKPGGAGRGGTNCCVAPPTAPPSLRRNARPRLLRWLALGVGT